MKVGEESESLVQNATEVMLTAQPYFNIVTDYQRITDRFLGNLFTYRGGHPEDPVLLSGRS